MLRSLLGQLFRHPSLKKYLLVTLLCTIVFTILTFPYGPLVTQIATPPAQKIFKGFSTGNLIIRPWGKIATDSLYIDTGGQRVAVRDLSVSFHPFQFLFGSAKGSLSTTAFEAQLGKISIKAGANLKSDLSLGGKNRIPQKGTFGGILKNITVKGISISSFPMPDMSISQLDVQFKVAQKIAKVEKFDFSGKDITGKISGSIEFDEKETGKSKLNLVIAINKNSGVLVKFLDIIEMQVGKSESPALQIRVTNTLASPKYEFVK